MVTSSVIFSTLSPEEITFEEKVDQCLRTLFMNGNEEDKKRYLAAIQKLNKARVNDSDVEKNCVLEDCLSLIPFNQLSMFIEKPLPPPSIPKPPHQSLQKLLDEKEKVIARIKLAKEKFFVLKMEMERTSILLGQVGLRFGGRLIRTGNEISKEIENIIENGSFKLLSSKEFPDQLEKITNAMQALRADSKKIISPIKKDLESLLIFVIKIIRKKQLFQDPKELEAIVKIYSYLLSLFDELNLFSNIKTLIDIHKIIQAVIPFIIKECQGDDVIIRNQKTLSKIYCSPPYYKELFDQEKKLTNFDISNYFGIISIFAGSKALKSYLPHPSLGKMLWAIHREGNQVAGLVIHHMHYEDDAYLLPAQAEATTKKFR